MSLAQIKARVVNIISAVSGIGKAYERTRFVVEEKVEKADFILNNQLNVWFVSRESKALSDMNVNQSMSDQRDVILVRGFLGLQDSADTEAQMDSLVDAVIVAINADRRPPSKLSGLVVEADPPQLRLQDVREFGPRKILSHHVEIAMAVQQAQLQ